MHNTVRRTLALSSILGYQNGTILAIFKSPCRPDASHKVWAQSNMVWEEMWFKEFQDGHHGSHFGYRNGTI